MGKPTVNPIGPRSDRGPCAERATERARGAGGETLAGVLATCSSFEMAEYRVCTSILILTIPARMRPGFDGVRTVSGEVGNHP